MNSNGFTLMGMAVTVATIGILAVMAMPAVETMFTRARQAEVKSNLHEIKAVQTAHIRVAGIVYGFDKFGYAGSGKYKCAAGDLPGAAFGWTPAACQTLRYNYTAVAGKPQASAAGSGAAAWTTNTYEVIAHAPADQGEQYLYVGCNGAGSSIYGHSSGDVWRLRMGGSPEVCRSIMDFCPDVSSKAKKRCDGEPFAPATQCMVLAPPGTVPPASPVVTPPVVGGGGGGSQQMTITVVYQPTCTRDFSSGCLRTGSNHRGACKRKDGSIYGYGTITGHNSGSYSASSYTEGAQKCIGKSFGVYPVWDCSRWGADYSAVATLTTTCTGKSFTNGGCICQ